MTKTPSKITYVVANVDDGTLVTWEWPTREQAERERQNLIACGVSPNKVIVRETTAVDQHDIALAWHFKRE